jgi:hypothetical protein
MFGRISSLIEQKLLNLEFFLSLKTNLNYCFYFIINLTRECIGNKGEKKESKKSLPDVCKLVLPTRVGSADAVLPRYTRQIYLISCGGK